jgi:hypothetical protein
LTQLTRDVREVTLRDDLRLTAVERTLVDCFRWGTERDQLALAARQALDRGLVDAHRLDRALEEAGMVDDFALALLSGASK